MDDWVFDLDGYLFGYRQPVVVTEFDPGVFDVRDQDTNSPVGSSRLFGRDYVTAPEWTFSLGVNRSDAAGALATLDALVSGWRLPSAGAPGGESVLRYTVGGRTRRVYGRARFNRSAPERRLQQGYVEAAGQFACSDALHYDDELRSVSVSLLPGVSGSHPLPAGLPFTFAPGGPRSGIIQAVGGDAPAPVVVTFQGPVVGPSAMVGGHLVAFPGLTLAFDQSVTVDTRAMTVTRQDGASLAGALSRHTYLPDVRLSPGQSEVVFSGSDLTGTSRCTVSWRPAHYGF